MSNFSVGDRLDLTFSGWSAKDTGPVQMLVDVSKDGVRYEHGAGSFPTVANFAGGKAISTSFHLPFGWKSLYIRYRVAKPAKSIILFLDFSVEVISICLKGTKRKSSTTSTSFPAPAPRRDTTRVTSKSGSITTTAASR